MSTPARAEAVDAAAPLDAVDHPVVLCACLGLAIAGFAAFMGMPMVVAALVQQFGLSDGQGGYLASTEYLGMFTASALAARVLQRVGRRELAAAGLALALGANLASLGAAGLASLLPWRFLAGLGCGTAYAVGVTVLASTRDTARSFMLLIFGQVLVNALIVYTFPWVAVHWRLAGMYLCYAALLLAAAPGLAYLPPAPGRARDRSAVPADAATAPAVTAAVATAVGTVPTGEDVPAGPAAHRTRVARGIPWLCLFAVFCFYLMIGAYWAYIEIMGLAVGLSSDFIGHALSLGIVLSLLACPVAYALSRRHGQSRPLLVALGSVALTLFASGLWFGPAAWLVGLAVINCFWNFTDIFQLGTIARIDPSGIHVSRVQGAQMLAVTVAPASAGWLLDRRLGYPALLIVFGACVALAFFTYLLVHALQHRQPGWRHAGL